VMRHAGSSTDALISTVGGAGKLSVEEADRVPYFRRWRPSPLAAEAPGIAPNSLPATPVAEAEKLTGAPTPASSDGGGER
jgi:hypothetical protein